MNYQDKVVIITGASSGIGAELARQLSRAGAKIALAGRREGKLREVAESCPGETLCVPTDVSRQAELEQLVTRTLTHFRRIDVVISNAGVGYGGALTDLTAQEIDYATQVNFVAPLQLVRLSLPHLARGAQLVIVSSIAPYAPLPFHSLYTAHKGGLLSACKSLSLELRPSGIAVSCVLPGTVWSEMMTESFQASLIEAGFPVKPMATVRAVNIMLRGLRAEHEEVRVWAKSERLLALLYRVAPRTLERMMAPTAPRLRAVMQKAMAAQR